MNTPLVSIIIPTFNRAGYLTQAIESALGQDYPNIEIIISDNASSDSTPEVAKRFLYDNRIKYFRNEKNLGMVGNWRKALFEYAAGEWVIILSDDDYFVDSRYISNAVALANRDGRIVLIHAKNTLLFEESKTFCPLNKDFPTIVDGRLIFMNYNFRDIHIFPCSALFKRDVAIRLNFFSFDNIIASDTLEFLRLSLHGNIGFIKDCVVVYRVHGKSLSKLTTVEELLKNNISFITIAYEYALAVGDFHKDSLIKWRKKMLRLYLNMHILGAVLDSRDLGLFKRFFTVVRRDYPFALGIFFYPINIIKLLTLRFPIVFNGLRRCKQMLSGAVNQ